MDTDICSICNNPLTSEDEVSKVHFAGLQSFIIKSKNRQDEKWKEWENIVKGQHIIVHEICRTRYSALRTSLSERKKPKLAVTEDPAAEDLTWMDTPAKPFDYAKLCMLCDLPLDKTHKPISVMNPLSDQVTMKDWAKSVNDEHAKEILRRIKHVQDNNACGMYHIKCRRSAKHYIPKPKDDSADKAFQAVADYIENSGEFKFELSTLRKVMEEGAATVLTNYMLHKKLEEKYGEDIFIARNIGKSPLYFYKTNNLFEKSANWLADPSKSLSDFDKNIILKITADIIKHDVRNNKFDVDESPLGESFRDSIVSVIPNSLKHFLNSLLGVNDAKKYLKRDSIAHNIISILRPRSFISQLQLDVGTYIYRKTNSKTIIDLLHKLGVSASYLKVAEYKACTDACTDHAIDQVFVGDEYRDYNENVDEDSNTENNDDDVNVEYVNDDNIEIMYVEE